MMTGDQVQKLIEKLKDSGDTLDQKCAETLQQAINGIDSAIASGNAQPATGARARGISSNPEAAAMWRRMIDVFDKK